jgi:hypothetical protein
VVLLILAFGYLLAKSKKHPGTGPILWGTVAFAILVAAPFLAYPALVRYRLPVDIAMLWTALYVLGSAGRQPGRSNSRPPSDQEERGRVPFPSTPS